MSEYARDHANALIAYFANLAANGGEVWVKGLETAKLWLRLIDSDAVADEQLRAIYGIAHANRYRSSEWNGMAGGIYEWVRDRGFTVPPREEFFNGGEYAHDYYAFTRLENADYFIEMFTLYSTEEPGYEPWDTGLLVATGWRDLLHAEEVTRLEAVNLVDNVKRFDRMINYLWFEIARCVYDWCDDVGYLDLVPQDRRQFLRNKDHREV